MASPMREMTTRPAECEKHGEFKAINYVNDKWSGCPKCSEEERAERQTAADLSAKRERCDTRLRHSGLEGRFRELGFDNFECKTPAQEKVLADCRAFVKDLKFNDGGGLWLIGPPGVGKTHLGSAMVRYVIEERDNTARMHSGREIIRMLRATWGVRAGRDWDGRAMNEEDLIYDLTHCGLLVIDEIGVGFGSEGEQVQLFDIIDGRYKHRRPTVLLSNLPAKELKVALGERSYDRLREGARILPCQWESHRGSSSPRASLEAVK